MRNENLESLKQKVIHGMVILTLRDFGIKILSVIGQIILVRLIAPQYFGLFAIIIFIVSVSELFTDLGLTHAIIREKKTLTSEQLNTIFTTKLLLSILSILLLFASFPAAKLFFNQLNNGHLYMLLLLGFTNVTKSLKGIIVALFDKELNFNVISKTDLIGTVIYFVTAIILALNKAYLWSFVLAIFFKEISELLIILYYKPWKPKLLFKFHSIKSMIKYGYFLQLGNVVLLVEHSIIPITGFNLSPYYLGLLQWSSNIASLSDAVFDNYGRAAFAGMTKIQDRRDKLSAAITKSVTVLNIFSFLFILLIFGFAYESTYLVLSKEWLPALPALYWFIGSLFFFGGSITIAHALMAIGKSKEILFLTTCNMVFEVALALFLLHKFSFLGIAQAVFIGNLTQFLGYLILNYTNGLRINIKQTYMKTFLIFLISFFVVLTVNMLFKERTVIFLFLKVFITIVVYLLFHFVYSKKEIKELYSSIKT